MYFLTSYTNTESSVGPNIYYKPYGIKACLERSYILSLHLASLMGSLPRSLSCRCLWSRHRWGSRPMSESLKRPHSSSLAHTLRTGVSGATQVRLLGNLRECNNSSIEIVPHRKVVELQSHTTCGRLGITKTLNTNSRITDLHYTMGAVRWEIITSVAEQTNDITLEVMTNNRKRHI